MRRANVISGVILAVFGLIMLVVVIPWQVAPGPDGMMSPRLVPSIMMLVVTLLSALLVFNNLRAIRDERAVAEPNPITAAELGALFRLGVVFALAIALYLWISPVMGGAALILGALLVLGERRPVVLIVMPAGLLLAVWLLFYKVLGTGIV